MPHKRLIPFSVSIVTFFIGILFSGCSKPSKNELLLEVDGLPKLQGGLTYTGWLILSDDTINAGSFVINENDASSEDVLTAEPNQIKEALSFGISIETDNGASSPSSIFVCSGNFVGDKAALSTNHSLSLQDNFITASGIYLTATVTDTAGTTHEYSGVWWVSDISGTSPGLVLPQLPNGWIYEGWVKISDQYVSTGRFSDPQSADDLFLYGDTQNPPFDYPGEDLLFNAPSGLTFPINLLSKELFISVENEAHVRTEPYLVILQTTIPSTADFNSPYQMDNVAVSLPSVTVTRKN